MGDRGTVGASEAAIAAQITRTLEDAGIYVAVEVADGEIVLEGEVDSEANWDAALDVARAAADGAFPIVDALDLTDTSPDSAFDPEARPLTDEPWNAGNDGTADDLNISGPEVDPDLTDDIGTTDAMTSAAEAIPYYPPTDPVVRPTTGNEELEILTGFGAGADEGEPEPGGQLGDEDLTAAVTAALARNALTSDLVIRVLVRNGVVHLRGQVPAVDDAEAAEAIAGDVRGVVEVREELGVVGA